MAKQAKYGMAPEGYDWYEMLRQYKAFKEIFKRNPKSSGASEEEVRLYYWMYNQTRLIYKGHMSDEHYYALLEAGVDIPNKGNLNDTYIRNVKSVLKKTPDKKDKLYTWAYSQQLKYNTGTLEKWRVDIWFSYGKKAVVTLETFGNSNQEWLRRLESYASLLKGNNLKNMTKEAAKWLNSQVEADRCGKLYEWKKQKLKSEGIALKIINLKEFNEYKKRNAASYQEYKAFVDKYGRKPNQKIEAEKKLYFWSRKQIKKIREGSLSSAEIKQFAKLGIVV